MKKLEATFKDYLDFKKLKYTRERERIFKEVLSTKSHFDVEDLMARFRKSKERISRATIFRTLSLLVESELLSKVRVADERIFYEVAHSDEHHDHIICLTCRQEIEFHDEELEAIQLRICSEMNFKLVKHTHMLYGYCKNCQ